MKKGSAICLVITAIGVLSLFYCSQAEATKPLSLQDIKALLTSKVGNARITTLVEERGVDFTQTKEDIEKLKQMGADSVLIAAIQRAFNNRNVEVVAPDISSNAVPYLSHDVHHELPEVEHRFKTDNEEGSIYIETEPASAEIHINGKYKAISPAEISLPAGQYTIVLIKQNYGPYPLSLKIKKGINAPVMVKLSPR